MSLFLGREVVGKFAQFGDTSGLLVFPVAATAAVLLAMQLATVVP
jgi:hypothetical protein